jgi:hypothetical protein
VFEEKKIDVMLKKFKEGIKGKMDFVNSVKYEGEGDNLYEKIGIIKIEDVIEELIKYEIVDEKDVWNEKR